MEMRAIVCIKPVPDPKHWKRLALDPETKTLIRKGIPGTINPLDRNALELALSLRDRHGGEVIVISMAPPDSKTVINEALAMGADRAVLLSDIAFAGADTLATAYVLAAGIEKLGNFDLVACGDQTIDGGTAQVSAQVAEFLGVPNVMHVTAVDTTSSGSRLVRSQIEHGYVVVEIRPPMMLSVLKEINKPRYVTMMNILAAEKKETLVWSSSDLDLKEPWVGLTGSPTCMVDLFVPEKRTRAEFLMGEPQEQAANLADRLHRSGFC
jgi:electron transfer flavoprotein beta subunit